MITEKEWMNNALVGAAVGAAASFFTGKKKGTLAHAATYGAYGAGAGLAWHFVSGKMGGEGKHLVGHGHLPYGFPADFTGGYRAGVRAGPQSLACKADRRSSGRWTGATRTCRTVSRPTSPAGLPMAAGDSSRNTRMRRNSSRCKSPCSKSTCSPCKRRSFTRPIRGDARGITLITGTIAGAAAVGGDHGSMNESESERTP